MALDPWEGKGKKKKKSTHKHQELEGTATFFKLPADVDKKKNYHQIHINEDSKQKLPVFRHLPPLKILCATDTLPPLLQAAKETRLSGHQEGLPLSHP